MVLTPCTNRIFPAAGWCQGLPCGCDENRRGNILCSVRVYSTVHEQVGLVRHVLIVDKQHKHNIHSTTSCGWVWSSYWNSGPLRNCYRKTMQYARAGTHHALEYRNYLVKTGMVGGAMADTAMDRAFCESVKSYTHHRISRHALRREEQT